MCYVDWMDQDLQTYSVDRWLHNKRWVRRYLIVWFDVCVNNCFIFYNQFWTKAQSGRLDSNSNYHKMLTNHTLRDFFNIQPGFGLLWNCTTRCSLHPTRQYLRLVLLLCHVTQWMSIYIHVYFANYPKTLLIKNDLSSDVQNAKKVYARLIVHLYAFHVSTVRIVHETFPSEWNK